VDDILVTLNDQDFITTLISQLQLEFAMKNLSQLTYFLGIEAIRNSSWLHLRQTRYIIDLWDCVQLTGIRPYCAPCVSGFNLSKFNGESILDPSEYRQTVGALWYVTLTRPDIAYSVNQLCQHMQAPTSAHWTAAKCVLRYLKHIHLIMVSSTNLVPLQSMPIVTLIGPAILMTDAPPVAMVILLGPISYLGLLRNNL